MICSVIHSKKACQMQVSDYGIMENNSTSVPKS